MRANSSGSRSATHAYCCACEQENRYVGSSSISATAEANVRVHLRTVSASGHSQAVSMCACPVATMRWAPDRAGTASAGASTARAATTRRRRRRADGRRRRGPARGRRGSRARRGSSSGQRPHHAVEHVEVVDERLGVGVDDDQLGPVEPVQRPLARRVRRARAATAELRERRVRGRLDEQLDRARRRSSTGTAWRRGWMPCTGRPLPSRTSPSHWNPGASARNPRSISASTRRPRPRRRDLAGEAEPGRGPRRTPRARRRRTAPARRGDGPASTVSGRRSRVDQRQHPLRAAHGRSAPRPAPGRRA